MYNTIQIKYNYDRQLIENEEEQTKYYLCISYTTGTFLEV